MHQQRLRSGQSYSFEQIIYGAPYKVKVLLLDTGNQGDFLVTEEDLFTYTSESDQERKHVKYACKQPVGGQTYSPLNDISSLFVNFDSSKWEILNAIEMISNHESFKSNANYHYVVYINGKFKDTLKEKSAFDAAVDILNFESHAAAQEYYNVQSEILRRNAIGNEDVSVVLPTSGSQSYCFDNSLNEPDKGCIFIGYLGDRVVEIKLFPHSAIADIEAIKEYWPEFVMNLWEGVFDNYSG